MARVPAFLAAVAFAAGVLLGQAAWRPPLWWMIALMAFTLGSLVFATHPSSPSQDWAHRMGSGLALVALAALGAFDIGVRDQQRALELRGRGVGSNLAGDEVQVTAHVLRDSTSRARGPSTSEIVDVESECI